MRIKTIYLLLFIAFMFCGLFPVFGQQGNTIKVVPGQYIYDTLTIVSPEPLASRVDELLIDIANLVKEEKIEAYKDGELSDWFDPYWIEYADHDLISTPVDENDPDAGTIDSIAWRYIPGGEERRVVIKREKYDTQGILQSKPVPSVICLMKKGRKEPECAYCVDYNKLYFILPETQKKVLEVYVADTPWCRTAMDQPWCLTYISDTLPINRNSLFNSAFKKLMEKVHGMVINGQLTAYQYPTLDKAYPNMTLVNYYGKKYWPMINFRYGVEDTIELSDFLPADRACITYRSTGEDSRGTEPTALTFLYSDIDYNSWDIKRRSLYSLDFSAVKKALKPGELSLISTYTKNHNSRSVMDTVNFEQGKPAARDFRQVMMEVDSLARARSDHSL
jgi:hypothetical protein